ncbi:MAG: hypothetical protein Q9165_007177 [Trypethelium subeluteriae]
MNSAESLRSQSPTKPTFACVRCSERKVKCDKQVPCGSCVRHSVQCVFRPPKPSRRKQRFLKDVLVDERLKRYEALLREKGIDPNQVTRTSEPKLYPKSSRSEVPETVWQLPAPVSTVSGPQTTIFKPQLLHGQRGTELVDNSLWSRVLEEIYDAEDAPEEDSADDESDIEASSDDFAYVLGWKTPISAFSHPPAELIHLLWQTFVENVNPLSKLVHIPSLQPAIEKAINNIEHIPRGFEALMYAIYSMAVLSLTDDECSELLGEARTILLSRYVAATKAALSRARFMSSTSIVVLQALVLHILSIRDACEPRAVWSLTGVAIRIAEVIGLRLDGTLLGLSPFETELHRRIWWQLRMHDFRAAELSGQAKFRNFDLDETSPKQPANVNDSDLYPTMPHAAVESSKPTEMIWIMFRSDLASFAASQKVKMQKLGKAVATSEEYVAMDDLQIKDGFIRKIEDMFETKYLRFCDPTVPLQLMASISIRAAINLIRFLAHHPRRWAHLDQVPVSEQLLVWNIVLQLLEQYNMMQTLPQIRRFSWSVPYFIQWHAVIHALDTLRASPLHSDALKAWRLIDALYENNSATLLGINRPIFVAVGNLCLRAYSARMAALTKEARYVSNPPAYITKLREQREAAKARRAAVYSRGDRREAPNSEKILTKPDTDVAWPDTTPESGEALGAAQPQQDPAAKQPPNPVQSTARTGDDAYWLSDPLDDGFLMDGAADMMNLDTDAILTQDSWLDTSSNEVIDWAQWDAWLSNLNPARPNMGGGPG